MCRDGVDFNNTCYCSRYACGKHCELRCYGQIVILVNLLAVWVMHALLSFTRNDQAALAR